MLSGNVSLIFHPRSSGKPINHGSGEVNVPGCWIRTAHSSHRQGVNLNDGFRSFKTAAELYADIRERTRHPCTFSREQRTSLHKRAQWLSILCRVSVCSQRTCAKATKAIVSIFIRHHVIVTICSAGGDYIVRNYLAVIEDMRPEATTINSPPRRIYSPMQCPVQMALTPFQPVAFLSRPSQNARAAIECAMIERAVINHRHDHVAPNCARCCCNLFEYNHFDTCHLTMDGHAILSYLQISTLPVYMSPVPPRMAFVSHGDTPLGTGCACRNRVVSTRCPNQSNCTSTRRSIFLSLHLSSPCVHREQS